MLNNKIIQQHEKAISLLELIIKIKNRKNEAQANLNLYKQTTCIFSIIKLFKTEASLTATVKRYTLVELRLTKRYEDVLKRINKMYGV